MVAERDINDFWVFEEMRRMSSGSRVFQNSRWNRTINPSPVPPGSPTEIKILRKYPALPPKPKHLPRSERFLISRMLRDQERIYRGTLTSEEQSLKNEFMEEFFRALMAEQVKQSNIQALKQALGVNK